MITTANAYQAMTFLFLISFSASACADKADDTAVVRHKTPDGIEYGTWGNPDTKPSPTLFMLSGTIDATLGEPYFRQCGNELAKLGYLVVSIDLPCHGAQLIAGEPEGISGWSHRAANNVDFVAVSNARLSRVLDHLIATSLTDPDKVAAGGTSRGGFLAIHFAAHDSRVRCVAGFAPVTELAALREFHDKPDHPLVSQLSLKNHVEKLAGRPVWIIIGDRDERVGTQHAIELANRLSAVAREQDIASNVELHVLSEPRGHTTPEGSPQLAADWIHQHLTEAGVFAAEPAASTVARPAAESITTHEYLHSKSKIATPYLLYHPVAETPSEKRSLVIFLYGAGGSISHYNLARPPYAQLREQLAERGYYVVVPELGQQHFMNQAAKTTLDGIVEEVMAEQQIPDDRVHVMGTSMGGGSSLAYAIHRPDLIRSVCAVMPMTDFALWVVENPKYAIPVAKAFGGSIQQVSEIYDRNSAIKNVEAFTNIPVMLVHGTSDTIVLYEHSRKLAELLRNRKLVCKLYTAESLTHEDTVMQDFQIEAADFFDAAVN